MKLHEYSCPSTEPCRRLLKVLDGAEVEHFVKVGGVTHQRFNQLRSLRGAPARD